MIIPQKVAEIMSVGDVTEGTWIEGDDGRISAKGRTLENVDNDRMGRGSLEENTKGER